MVIPLGESGARGAIPAVTLAAWFESQVRRTPTAPALLFAGRTITYSELNTRANRLARQLIALGVGPERMVGILLARSDLLVTVFLAVLKAGGTYMPIDPELPRQRVSYMVKDAAPTVILTTAKLAGALPDRAPFVLLREGDDLAAGEDGEADIGDLERLAPVQPDTAMYLLYTSGSTGRPKGVTMPCGAMVNLLAWHLRNLPTGAGRVTVQFTTLSFDISVQEMLSTLLGGALLAIPPDEVRLDPARLVPWMERHGVTDLFAPNVVIDAICRAAHDQGRTLPSLAHIVQGGEPLLLGDKLRALFRTQPGRRLHNHYGPTETHAVTSYPLPARSEDWSEPVPIGQPIWNTRVYLLDETLTRVTPGAAGEVYIAGDCLARGYHGQPGQTAERFLPDPFGPPGSRMYRTGDLGRRRPDGAIDYLGRIDHQVKIRGVRVELGEVEAAIRRVPEVEAAVVAAAGEGSQRRLDAYLVPVPGAVAVAARTREALRSTLPAAMVPSTFTVLESLPLNPNGKVDRVALPPPCRPAAEDADAPRTLQEQALGRVFAAVLGVENVGIHDSFYDLGGHSLLAAQLVGRVRADLGCELSIADVLRFPSVARLAARLATGDGDRPAIRRQVRPSPLPASYAQRQLWILDRLEGPSSRYNELLALRLAGQLDRAALRAALADVTARHESLRTILPMVDGEPCQQVLEPAAEWSPMEELDAPTAPVDEVIREVARRPFALAADPPIRPWLVRLAPGQHLLLIVIHHIACDGASIGPLVRDLAAAYNARLAGRAPARSPTALQYADYALWQRELLGAPGEPTPQARRQASFWARTLAGMPEVTPLPTDRPRPAVRGSAGRRLPFEIGSRLHQRLAALGRRHRATVFMTVHAALVALMRRRGGGDDVAIGAVVSGRGDGVLDDLVGFFLNTLVLRVDAAGDPPFDELLERARDADVAALAHQDLPFDQVVEIVNPARSLAHHPLVQVVLAFQVGEAAPPDFAGLTAAFEPVDAEVAKFDLCLLATERFTPDRAPGGMVGWLEYATDIYDAATAEGMLSELLDLLTSVAGGPIHPGELSR